MNTRLSITAALFLLCGSIGFLSFSLARGEPNRQHGSEGNYISAKTQETPSPTQTPTPVPSPSPSVTPTPVPEPEPVPTPTPFPK